MWWFCIEDGYSIYSGKSWNFVPKNTILEKECALYQTIVGPHQAMMRMDKNYKGRFSLIMFHKLLS